MAQSKIDANTVSQQIAQVAQLASKVQRAKLNAKTFSFEYLGIIKITLKDIIDLFSKIKLIYVMGPESRAIKVATKVQIALKCKNFTKIGDSDYYSIYKIGDNVLSCSHGMGLGSISIFLNELIRILRISGNKNDNYSMIRIGSSGGIGVESSTLVITKQCLDPITLKPEWIYYSCGNRKQLSTIMNEKIQKKLFVIAQAKKVNCKVGSTISTETYYEGQARLDGSVCGYNEKEKMKWLKKINSLGVRNFEMEGTVFSGICNFAGIKCGMICVAYLNRLNEDTVSKKYKKEVIDSWMDKLIDVVVQYMYINIVEKK